VQRSRRRRSFLASSALDPPLSLSFLICRNYIYSFDTARSGVYVTMGCPSVWLSYLAPQPWHEASLLLCPPMAGDIDRLLHGASAAGAVAFRSISTAALQSAANASSVVFTATQEAEHRLGSYVLTALRSYKRLNVLVLGKYGDAAINRIRDSVCFHLQQSDYQLP